MGKTERNLQPITIIGTYVPHASKWRPPFQGEYLQGLESSVQNLRERYPRDCQILAGDINVKLARNVEGLTGRFSMHANNSKGGERFLELMRNTNLVHSSSHFCPSSTAPRGSATFFRPKSEKRPRCLSQIDHIHVCVSERYKSSVQSSKVYWYPSIRKYTEPYDHGHGLVAIEFRFKIAVRKSEMQVNLDYSSLKCEETRQKLSELIVTKLSTGQNRKNRRRVKKRRKQKSRI